MKSHIRKIYYFFVRKIIFILAGSSGISKKSFTHLILRLLGYKYLEFA
jgi:hypothetical protein